MYISLTLQELGLSRLRVLNKPEAKNKATCTKDGIHCTAKLFITAWKTFNLRLCLKRCTISNLGPSKALHMPHRTQRCVNTKEPLHGGTPALLPLSIGDLERYIHLALVTICSHYRGGCKEQVQTTELVTGETFSGILGVEHCHQVF